MLSDVIRILTFQPYRVRTDDPFIHFTKKVKGKPFTVAILGHQQIKYAKARFRKGTLELMKASTAFVDNFQRLSLEGCREGSGGESRGRGGQVV